MGNNPSQALAAANVKSGFNKAMKDVNKQLGLEEAKVKKEAERQAVGCANRKESQLRQQERQQEYKQKQLDRQARKEKLKQKWTSSRLENKE